MKSEVTFSECWCWKACCGVVLSVNDYHKWFLISEDGGVLNADSCLSMPLEDVLTVRSWCLEGVHVQVVVMPFTPLHHKSMSSVCSVREREAPLAAVFQLQA